ncbi:hypothetical protein ACFWEJ_28650, partial [Promicromonospora sp. NPDC060204]|uniref:hypothetical protein n=1 Tax=Promicromonospora sp. NPDC060204 TaxID=3347071 RepID=UPI00365A81EF
AEACADLDANCRRHRNLPTSQIIRCAPSGGRDMLLARSSGLPLRRSLTGQLIQQETAPARAFEHGADRKEAVMDDVVRAAAFAAADATVTRSTRY